MTKNKVGAEPKKRVKHVFTKDAGIHEGDNEYAVMWVDDEFCTIKDFEADAPEKAIKIAFNWCVENRLISIN